MADDRHGDVSELFGTLPARSRVGVVETRGTVGVC